LPRYVLRNWNLSAKIVTRFKTQIIGEAEMRAWHSGLAKFGTNLLAKCKKSPEKTFRFNAAGRRAANLLLVNKSCQSKIDGTIFAYDYRIIQSTM